MLDDAEVVAYKSCKLYQLTKSFTFCPHFGLNSLGEKEC